MVEGIFQIDAAKVMGIVKVDGRGGPRRHLTSNRFQPRYSCSTQGCGPFGDIIVIGAVEVVEGLFGHRHASCISAIVGINVRLVRDIRLTLLVLARVLKMVGMAEG